MAGVKTPSDRGLTRQEFEAANTRENVKATLEFLDANGGEVSNLNRKARRIAKRLERRKKS